MLLTTFPLFHNRILFVVHDKIKMLLVSCWSHPFASHHYLDNCCFFTAAVIGSCNHLSDLRHGKMAEINHLKTHHMICKCTCQLNSVVHIDEESGFWCLSSSSNNHFGIAVLHITCAVSWPHLIKSSQGNSISFSESTFSVNVIMVSHPMHIQVPPALGIHDFVHVTMMKNIDNLLVLDWSIMDHLTNKDSDHIVAFLNVIHANPLMKTKQFIPRTAKE